MAIKLVNINKINCTFTDAGTYNNGSNCSVEKTFSPHNGSLLVSEPVIKLAGHTNGKLLFDPRK